MVERHRPARAVLVLESLDDGEEGLCICALELRREEQALFEIFMYDLSIACLVGGHRSLVGWLESVRRSSLAVCASRPPFLMLVLTCQPHSLPNVRLSSAAEPPMVVA